MIKILKKDKSKIYIRKGKIILNKDTLKILVKRLGLRGSGTKQDPIIINSTTNIPVKIFFSKVDCYLVLRNLNLSNLNLYRCQNITIENCRIDNLVFNRCKHIVVRNSSIMKIENVLSRANVFKNIDVLRVKNNTLESRYFDPFSYMAIIIGFIFSYFAIRELIYLNFHWLTLFFLFTGPSTIIIISFFLKTNFEIRKLKPNEFHNNTPISHINQVFIQKPIIAESELK